MTTHDSAPRPYRRYNRARWELDRQRHQLDDAVPPPPWKEADTLGRVMPGIVSRLQALRPSWEEELVLAWSETVGADIAAKSRPGRIKNGVLTLYATNSIWVSELGRLTRGPLLTQIKARLPSAPIRSIRVELDPGA